MGFTEVLTIVFIVLKLLGEIDWSWFLVLLPEILAVAIYIILCIVVAVQNCRINKSINRILKDTRFKDMWGQWNNECCVADWLKHIETATLWAWISRPDLLVGLLPYRQMERHRILIPALVVRIHLGQLASVSDVIIFYFFFTVCSVPKTLRSRIGYVRTSDFWLFCDY